MEFMVSWPFLVRWGGGSRCRRSIYTVFYYTLYREMGRIIDHDE